MVSILFLLRSRLSRLTVASFRAPASRVVTSLFVMVRLFNSVRPLVGEIKVFLVVTGYWCHLLFTGVGVLVVLIGIGCCCCWCWCIHAQFIYFTGVVLWPKTLLSLVLVWLGKVLALWWSWNIYLPIKYKVRIFSTSHSLMTLFPRLMLLSVTYIPKCCQWYTETKHSIIPADEWRQTC